MSATERLMLHKGERVHAVGAGIAHGYATGHDGAGCNDDYDCEVCRFSVEHGVVVRGGMIQVEADTPAETETRP